MALQLHISGLNMWQMFVDDTILKRQEGVGPDRVLGSHCPVEFQQKSECFLARGVSRLHGCPLCTPKVVAA